MKSHIEYDETGRCILINPITKEVVVIRGDPLTEAEKKQVYNEGMKALSHVLHNHIKPELKN